MPTQSEKKGADKLEETIAAPAAHELPVPHRRPAAILIFRAMIVAALVGAGLWFVIWKLAVHFWRLF